MVLVTVIVYSSQSKEEEPLYSTIPIRVFFSPPQDLNHKLAEYISCAQESIKACFYSIKSEEVASALIRAHLRGVEVRVVMDESRLFEEGSFYPKLKNFGIVRIDTEVRGLMHNKFCIIDERIVWTGSYNPSRFSIYENNDVVVIESNELAYIYTYQFEALVDDRKVEKNICFSRRITLDEQQMVEVYFSPEDSALILRRMRQLLEKADFSIYFAHFTFTRPDIAYLLIKKATDGVDVKGIMEYDQINRYSRYGDFELMEIDVRKDKNYSFAFHHKFFIIDGGIVITGSLNPTMAALKKNRENILIIHSPEVARIYMEYFKNLRKSWYRR